MLPSQNPSAVVFPGSDLRSPSHGLIILTGPSCAGKTPLLRHFLRSEPEVSRHLATIVPFTSRARRNTEADGRDYNFRTRAELEAMRGNPRYLIVNARNDIHGIDRDAIRDILEHSHAVYEGNPYVARALLEEPSLRAPRLGIFVSPLSHEEIRDIVSSQGGHALRDVVGKLMRNRLLRRTSGWGVPLTTAQQDDLETRATAAYDELRDAWRYHHIIPNHDGEDSDHWETPVPIGDARRTLAAFTAILLSGNSPAAEHWESGLIPL